MAVHHGYTLHQPPSHNSIHYMGKDPREAMLKCIQTKAGRKCIAIIVPIAILLAVLLLGIKILGGPGKLGHPSSGAYDLSLYTTLAFPVSGLYCNSYTITKYSGSSLASLSWTTSMYILNKKPPLFSEHNFTIHRGGQSMIALKPGEFYQWSFLLHAGSRYEINSCLSGEGSDSEVKLYVIPGTSKFNEWVQDPTSMQDRYNLTQTLEPCSSSKKQDFSQWQKVHRDDKYYFIYSSSKFNLQLSHVWINMSFRKLEYSINQSDITCLCTPEVSYHYMYSEYYACQSCDLPLSFSGFIVITTTPQDQDAAIINWEDKIYVTWSCDGSFKAYLLIFCLPLMVVFILALLFKDIPKLFMCRKSGDNVTQETVQPMPQCCNHKVLFAFKLFVCALMTSTASLCVLLLMLTLCLKVLSAVTGGIPGLSNNDLKLGLLAAGAILFVISVLCNKLREWIQKKFDSLSKTLRLSQRAAIASTPSVADTNTQISAKITKDRLKFQIYRLVYLSYMIPIFMVVVVLVSTIFVFLEGFYPVLTTYGSETDSDIFTPGDSRIFHFYSFFCLGYSISSYGSPHLSASLHLLTSADIMENRSNSYINSNESMSINMSTTWHFYLNDNSSARMKVCVYDIEPYEAYYVDVYTYDAYVLSRLSTHLIFSDCSLDLSQFTIKNASKGPAGKYLIVLYTNSSYWVNIHIEIELDQYEYFIADHVNSSTLNMCSISSHTQDSCNVSAPASTGSMMGLITVQSDQPIIDWHETISITKTCEYHWATWTALWLPVLVINILFFTLLLGVFYIALYKERKKNFLQGLNVSTENGERTEAAEAEETQSLLPDNMLINADNYGTIDVQPPTVASVDYDATDNDDDPPGNPDTEEATGDAGPTLRSDTVAVVVDIEHTSADGMAASNSHLMDLDHMQTTSSADPISVPSTVDTVVSNDEVKGEK